MRGLGVQTLPAIENPCMTYSQLSEYLVPAGPSFWIRGFNQPGPGSTVVFIIENNQRISGPAQFKPMLFKA